MKQQIEQKLNIPIDYQKIIYLGRPLIDDNTFASYPKIKDGTKLTLVIKKPDPLKDVIFRCFRKFYNEEQSEKLTEHFMIDFHKKVKQFSLDDLERIAIGLTQQLPQSEQRND